MKLFKFIFFFCLLPTLSSGQVRILELPIGNYNKPIDLENDTIRIVLKIEPLSKDTLQFTKRFNSNSTTFHGPVYIPFAKFHNNVFFLFSKFRDVAYFSNSEFQKIATFSNVTFLNETYFNTTIFQDDVGFSFSILKKYAEFANAQFKNNVIFGYTKFRNNVNFSDVTFSKNADFTGAIFQNELDFTRANCKGRLIFTLSQMPNILKFNHFDSFKVDFRDVLIDSLQNRKFTKADSEHTSNNFDLFSLSKKLNKCVILLKGANLNNIILPYDRFWVDVSNYSYEEKTSLYENLIKVCKSEGMDESVEGWDIELKKIQNIHNKSFSCFGVKFTFWGHVYNWIQGVFWNYGYSKGYIFFWIFGIFICFTLLNWFIYPHLLMVYYNPKLGINLFQKYPTSVRRLIIVLKQSSLSTRLSYLLHYTGIIFFGLKLEHSEMNFKYLKWVTVLYFQFIVGLFLLGFALNYVLSK